MLHTAKGIPFFMCAVCFKTTLKQSWHRDTVHGKNNHWRR